jgi:hypothetical protein
MPPFAPVAQRRGVCARGWHRDGGEEQKKRGPGVGVIVTALYGGCPPRAALGDGCQLCVARAVSHIPAVSSTVPSISFGFIILGAYASHPFSRAICHCYNQTNGGIMSRKCSNWPLRPLNA